MFATVLCTAEATSYISDVIDLPKLTNTLVDLFADSLASENSTDLFVSTLSVLNNKCLSSACDRVRPVNPAVESRAPLFKPTYVDRESLRFMFVDIGNEENER
jgi:hypothetical protein